ncbi:hypothetical protein UNDYM_2285 [Undibacterium sp. YM2]|uniref:hypothetical protein n=1 Tax=Undibacterium sp. YM2 TaxID=2058625 RepID=UPI001331F9E0|nr:hypothetical protein [Undibacterium sp. YM2]BBB66538.1 hypothetical protein UNDYM_2285 [Undibacterium sp. YM2]
MAFSDDSGGFAFVCNDGKFMLNASTWNTRLSQLGTAKGALYIMTNLLPNPDYIAKIISKRAENIFIIANEAARQNALQIKRAFPKVRIVLHPKMNAKLVLLAPETVWVATSDFGKTDMVETAIGLHSATVFNRALETLFNIEWAKSIEIQ